MSELAALDLFAGPGGWDLGARAVGLDPLGIEWDDAACATREAAGLRTHQGDVSALDPENFGPIDLLIASPPCQAWSLAGKRDGEKDIANVYEATRRVAAGWREFTAREWAWADPRSELVVEPLRWALALEPRLIALEQVPPVLDYWRHVASILDAEGYRVWTGILSAERYGVPQTRKRAILLANRDGLIEPPLPTHQEYRPGEPAWAEPVATLLEGEILPWISMADALGWGDGVLRHSYGEFQDPRSSRLRDTDRPSPVVDTKVFGWKRRPGESVDETRREMEMGDRVQDGGGNVPRPVEQPAATLGTRSDLARWRVGLPRRGDQQEQTEDGYRERDFRDEDEPAFALTEKARGWERVKMRADSNERATERGIEEPAPTIKAGHDSERRVWVEGDPTPVAQRDEPEDVGADPDDPPPSLSLMKRENRPEFGSNSPPRRDDQPAPTLDTVSGQAEWVEQQPATTVQGDARIFPPGHFHRNDERNARERASEPEQPELGVELDDGEEWTEDRPATTVSTDSRVFPPGHKLNADDERAGRGGQLRSGKGFLDTRQSHAKARSTDDPAGALVGQNLAKGASVWTDDPVLEPTEGTGYKPTKGVRVTVEEASILQSFPPDYPWQGSRSKRFEQIGNAVPPLLAKAVLSALAGVRK